MTCRARVFKANGFYSSMPKTEVEGRTVDDACLIFGAISPCLEGLVDRSGVVVKK